MTDRYLDAGVAAAKLAERSGCTGFELAATGGVWHAWAEYQTKKIAVDGHSSQAGAAIALAERLLRSATCRCLRPVALAGDPGPGRCRWRLVGDAWQSSCEAPPITMPGQRGDLDALAQVVASYHAHRPAPVDIDTPP